MNNIYVTSTFCAIKSSYVLYQNKVQMRVYAVLTLAKDIFLFTGSVSNSFMLVYDGGGYMPIF